jgi:Transposase DDE domain group 1
LPKCEGKGVAGILRWLFWRLKRAFPGVKIILRADAGFSLPEILRVCERSNVGYAIGFTRNAVTERKMADLLERARLQFVQILPVESWWSWPVILLLLRSSIRF